MATLQGIPQHNKNGTTIIKGYQVGLTKSKIENICKWKKGDNLKVEYLENKVIMTKE